jgi:DNA-binding MarR family transcriptional regulator
MSDRLKSLMKSFDNDVSLGLGVVVVVIGLLLRYVSPFEVFVEMWLFSVLGTVVLGVGFMLVVVGFIRLFTDRTPSHQGGKPLSQEELEKRYSEIGSVNSSSGAKAIETLAGERKPLNRKEIAERSGLSISDTVSLLKSFVNKGFVLEFQARSSYYYALTEKGLRLTEDIKAAAQNATLNPSGPTRYRLVESWLHKQNSPYYKAKPMKASRRLKPKQMIIGQQAAIIFGFLGGLFLNLVLNLSAAASQTMMLEIGLVILCWAVATILCAVKVAGGLGVVTLALAWLSGFIVIKGDPLMSVGVTLLMSSVMMGAFLSLYSGRSRQTCLMTEQ